jgi:hypothetical protein
MQVAALLSKPCHLKNKEVTYIFEWGNGRIRQECERYELIPIGILMIFFTKFRHWFQDSACKLRCPNKITILIVSLYIYSSLCITVFYLGIFLLIYIKDDF